MILRKIETATAPKAIGPYSQAIGFENLLFISGQIPLDPESGKMIQGAIEQQTRQALKNIEEILKADGLGFEHVVKVEIFLTDLADFQAVNAIYAQTFSHSIKPARQLIQAARLPMDSLIEISCIAAKY